MGLKSPPECIYFLSWEQLSHLVSGSWQFYSFLWESPTIYYSHRFLGPFPWHGDKTFQTPRTPTTLPVPSRLRHPLGHAWLDIRFSLIWETTDCVLYNFTELVTHSAHAAAHSVVDSEFYVIQSQRPFLCGHNKCFSFLLKSCFFKPCIVRDSQIFHLLEVPSKEILLFPCLLVSCYQCFF